MRAVDLAPVDPADQTQRPADLFLIFVGANIVATTLQVGASLPSSLGPSAAAGVIAAGALGGAALTAALAPTGSRLRVPSIVAARAVLGHGGAALLALLLFLTNFAWIALNNAIAASITVRMAGGPPAWWAVELGVAATLIVLGGPRTAALVDRVAVPLLLASGVVFTVACIRTPMPAWPVEAPPASDLVRGLDIVAGYQVSWLLMFADYPRFVRSGRAAGVAVFLGLALTALWFMPLGYVAAAVAGSSDPGAMVTAVGLGWWGALLVAVAALTTNFVNIYMSALAFKSLRPSVSGSTAVWIVGGVGAALGFLSSGWLDQFAAFTLILAGGLVPIGGILLAHYLVLAPPVNLDALYTTSGPGRALRGISAPGAIAWTCGAAMFAAAGDIGASLPALVTSLVAYVLVFKWQARRART
ncbi:MAG: cytosine permease [Vicinamibacterales bacterium]